MANKDDLIAQQPKQIADLVKCISELEVALTMPMKRLVKVVAH